MKESLKEKRPSGTRLLTLCLLFLFNPYIKIFDLFPDFIVYALLIRTVADAAIKAPYFEELRSALKKLCVLSAVRFISLAPLAYFQTRAETVDDTVTLLTFVFCVLEAVWAVSAVNNFTKALGYLSERTSQSALYAPFATRSGKMSLDSLATLTYVFIAVKCAANFIPEMTRLSRTGIEGGFNPASLYPYLFIPFFLLALVIGIAWYGRVRCYFRHVSVRTGGILSAVEELVTDDKIALVESQRALKRKKSALTLMTVAAFLNIEIVFTDFREINLLPAFIFAIAISAGFFKLVQGTGKYTAARISSIVFSLISVARTVIYVRFLTRYAYSDLISSQAAKAEYKLVIFAALIEFAALLFFIASLSVSMAKYTDVALRHEHSDGTMINDVSTRRTYRKKAAFFGIIGVILGALKALNVVVNATVNEELVSTSDTTVGVVYYSDMPWLPLVIGVCAILYGFYAVHYLGAIRDDVEMKHAMESHE